jgi:PAS domain-containing protein
LAVLPDIKVVNDRIEILMQGGSVNSRVCDMPEDERAFLREFGIKAIFMTPVFTHGEFWGIVTLENHTADTHFADDSIEADLLQSAAYIFANAVIRAEMQQSLLEAEERLKLMLDSVPLCCQLWDKNFNVLDCNEAGVRLYGLKDKQEYLDRFFEFSPEFQPDGQRSDESAVAYISKAFAEGLSVFDWLHQKPDGTPIPAKITLARVKYGNDYVVAGYTEDMRGK